MPRARASPGEPIWTGRPSSRISPPSPRKRAGHDLDQRRLAGAVLAHQRMNFAGLDPKIDVVQRAHAGKGLRHAEHLNSRGQGLRPVVRPCGHELSPGRSHFTSLCPGDERAPPAFLPQLCWKWRGAPDGIWPAARARVGLHGAARILIEPYLLATRHRPVGGRASRATREPGASVARRRRRVQVRRDHHPLRQLLLGP